MLERLIYDENREPLVVSPVIAFETHTDLGTVVLDYGNTTIKYFGGEGAVNNHVEYRSVDNVIGLPFSVFADPDVEETLKELNFPSTFDPIPIDGNALYAHSSFLETNDIYDIAEVDGLPEHLLTQEQSSGHTNKNQRPSILAAAIGVGAGVLALALLPNGQK